MMNVVNQLWMEVHVLERLAQEVDSSYQIRSRSVELTLNSFK